MNNLQIKAVRQTRKPFTFSKTVKDRLFVALLLAPALIILTLVIGFPIAKGVWLSFFDYTLATRNNPQWNNFANYTKLFQSGEIFTLFGNTLIFVAGVVIIQFVIAMTVALLLNTKIPGRNLYRSFFLIPWTIPSVVVALLWTWLFQPQYGVLNFILQRLGVVEPELQWTQHPNLAMVAIIIAAVWRQFPMMMVMFLAGLQSVPADLIEAAEIDGASKPQVFRHITLPCMRAVLDTTIIVAIINNFQMFTIIYNMTAGGPVDRTTTLSIGAYVKAFNQFDLGAGSAIGVLWLVALGGGVYLYNRLSEKKRDIY
jgi:multiple sugar transport system permease protein